MIRTFFPAWARSRTPTAPRAARPEPPRRRLNVEGLETRIVPFKPYTHVMIAQEARADVIDDGMVTIEGRQYAVDAELVTALRNHPDYFNAGTVGPDGFPDLIMGQGVIHPTNTGLWLNHVLASARAWTGPDRAEVLAWSHGFLSHAIGDMWAHTLVNEFSGGPFPDAVDVVAEKAALANALRHIILEGYIGDATPGYDANPNRTVLPNGDVSDDSTPGIPFAAPHQFIFETFVREGSGPAGNTTDKGKIIDFFYDLRDALRTAAGPRPANPIDVIIGSFDDTAAAYNRLISYPTEAFFDVTRDDFDDAWADLGRFGITALTDGFEAIFNSAANAVNGLRFAIYGHFLHAWADDIDTGLQHWGELGLGLTNALFNPQARRDVQNFGRLDAEDDLDRITHENGIGALDVIMHELGQDHTQSAHGGQSFFENHLFSMLGAPDVLLTIGDRIGDFAAALGSLLDQVKNAFPQLDFITNPITQTIQAIKDKAVDLVKDVVSEAVGVDFDQLEAILENPSSRLDDTSINYLGESIPLFHPDDHEKLDGYLGIIGNHHTGPGGILGDSVTFDRLQFAAFGNAVTMTKLSLLNGATMDLMIGDLRGGVPYVLYGPGNGNVMTTVLPGVDGAVSPDQWLLSADGDHAWRSDREPVPGDLKPGAGSGNFPLWESCLLRDPVFRVLFDDWESGPGGNFPDYGDDHSHDPNETPPAPTFDPATGVLTITGSDQDDALTLAGRFDIDLGAVIDVAWPNTIYYCEETVTYPVADLTKIVVMGRAGNDSLSFNTVIPVPLEFYGEAGSDTLTVDDRDYTGATTGEIAATTVTGPSVVPEGLTYDATTEWLNVWYGSGADAITIRGTQPGSTTMLEANDGADTFTFAPGANLAGTADGGLGSDAVDLSARGPQRVRVLALGGADGFNLGGVPAVTGGLLNLDRLVLKDAPGDGLTGLNAASTWNLIGSGVGNYTESFSARALAFTGVDDLVGGSDADWFTFSPLGRVPGSVDGGAGFDRLNFAARGSVWVTLLAVGGTDGFNGMTAGTSPISGGFANIDGVIGSTAGTADRLSGRNVDADWLMRGGGESVKFYRELQSGRALIFDNFEQLYGGSGVDRFTIDFGAGPVLPAVGLTVNGGVGQDQLAALGSAGRDAFNVSATVYRVNRQTMRYTAVEILDARGGAGNDAFAAVSGLTNIVKAVRFYGEAGNDTAVVAPATVAALTLDGGAGTDTLTIQRGTARYAAPLPPRGAVSGTYLFTNRKPIVFVSWEIKNVGISRQQP